MYLHQISTYRPEKRVDIYDIKESVGLSDKEYERITDFHKLRYIMDSGTETSYSMVKKSVKDLFETNKIMPDDLGGIIYGHAMQSHPDGNMFLEKLKKEFDLGDIPAFTISDLNCVTPITAIEIATKLLENSDKKYILLLFAEKMYTDSMRKIEDMTVFSDGAAACLISSQGDSNKIICVNQFVDSKVSSFGEWDDQSYRWFQMSYFLGIKKILKLTEKKANINLQDIKLIIPHNVNFDTWELASRSLNIPFENIYTNNIAKLGHVSGCDLLLNLQDSLHEFDIPKDSYYLMLSVGLGGAYGSVLMKK
ncbi:3-oxoacyl-[acyl-carrier-protein] synthase III C-terminal domain-containing protein [Bacillus toyonensis]|uniref:3-oxoacyl-ACP synthase n=1 Tax=Bacillus toyonensis TaxID=155322 RepID=A0AB73R7F6_9BACI|nr:3-oxoacyl-[acyl-carrier-protein] synthase III C-terminal domain-containing protein [Bacillus toyonensis]PEI86536.1 hypothetical protein CN678_11670 [Bacillus toyonensis]PEL51516.1 hypothetical protein CN638_13480 [Bacillus toyonensis]PEP83719.1 hypothetical protein CN581_03905 [Bacillus toyonensis]PGB58785.1 hypothetical protein COM00_21480 [Bacillus toyonensis]